MRCRQDRINVLIPSPEVPNRLVKGIACLGPGYDTRGPCHGREGTEGTLTVHVTTPTVMVAALPFT